MKLKLLTKILSTVLVVVMMCTMFTACGGAGQASDNNNDAALQEALKNLLSVKTQDSTLIESNTDFDTIMTAGQYRVSSASSAATMENCPAEIAGALIVMETIADSRLYQFYLGNTNNAAIYTRYYSGSKWGTWKKVAYDEDVDEAIENDALSILSMFNHIECIGDSLTYSAVYTTKDQYRPAYVTYPQALSKITGTPVTQMATCSFDPKEWWDEYSKYITERPNQLVIMYLGTNGGLTDTLDTDAPKDAPPATWTNSNTGKYARIINAYKEVGAKIILVKCYKTSASKDINVVNAVIEQLGERFGCAVVENDLLADDIYHYYPDLSGKNNLHYNDLGYIQFAKQLVTNINRLPADQLKLLLPQ